MKKIIIAFLLIAGLMLTFQGAAQARPAKVLFGMYPTALYDFDFNNGTYKMTFYAWWRSEDPNFAPEKSIDILNAAEIKTSNLKKGKNGNEYFTKLSYFTLLHQHWNIKYFPFDRQFLEMEFEDQNLSAQDLVFVVDDANSGISKSLIKKGWDIINFKIISRLNSYQTNFGNIERSDLNIYSRIISTIEIKRKGWRPYVTYFIGFFTSIFLCCMVFLISSYELAAQAGFMVAAIFSAVTNKYIVDQLIPFSTRMSLTDAIELATFLMIMLTYLISLIFYVAKYKMSRKKYMVIHFIAGGILLFLYVVFVGFYTYQAVIS